MIFTLIETAKLCDVDPRRGWPTYSTASPIIRRGPYRPAAAVAVESGARAANARSLSAAPQGAALIQHTRSGAAALRSSPDAYVTRRASISFGHRVHRLVAARSMRRSGMRIVPTGLANLLIVLPSAWPHHRVVAIPFKLGSRRDTQRAPADCDSAHGRASHCCARRWDSIASCSSSRCSASAM